jgi:hypothetical protein
MIDLEKGTDGTEIDVSHHIATGRNWPRSQSHGVDA